MDSFFCIHKNMLWLLDLPLVMENEKSGVRVDEEIVLREAKNNTANTYGASQLRNAVNSGSIQRTRHVLENVSPVVVIHN